MKTLGSRIAAPALFLLLLSTPPTRAADAAPGSTGHAEDLYGKKLAVIAELGIGRCIDAEIAGDRLFVIGSGQLHLFDITDPQSPTKISSLGGLGSVRQIEIAGDVACITAREDGIFLVDVSQPQSPQLLSHYDSIELATGIAVSGDIAFVACRTAGVELVDISDPRKPVHLSTVHTGEAQSVTARDGFLYAGVWAARELVVCDVRDPHKPFIVSRAPLDGYGDGVDVHGRYCYVATGHHSAATPRKSEADPGYGHGHGLEIFDISDPAAPEFVSRIKTPPFYAISNDTWTVTVSGRHAFLGDTHNGMFVVDIADPQKLRFVAHHQLPFFEDRGGFSPVGGFAVGDGVVYAAGAWSDLHVLDAAGLAAVPDTKKDNPPEIGPPPPPARDPRFRVYRPGGQVHGVAVAEDNVAFVAAGMAGLHAVRFSPDIAPLRQYATRGFAFDVAVHGKRVFVSEGDGGLSIWKHEGHGELSPLGRYSAGGKTVKQVEVPPPGNHALLQAGASRLHIVDVTDPAAPERVLEDGHPGLLYFHPIAQGLAADRYAACLWHVSGFFWFDLAGTEGPRPSGDVYPFRTGSRNGMAHLDSGDRSLVTYRSGYLLLARGESRPPEELPYYTVKGHSLSGKPTIDGDRLFTSNRYDGKVVAVDISDPTAPKLLSELHLREHPSPVVVHEGLPLIPGGYDGLLIWDEMAPGD